MAQQMGGIDPLLDSFFGFMRRKTDFFSGATSEGAAQETVLKAFQKNKAKADEEAKIRAMLPDQQNTQQDAAPADDEGEEDEGET